MLVSDLGFRPRFFESTQAIAPVKTLHPPLLMDAFNPIPPEWTKQAKHALTFCCPACGGSPDRSQRVWINRRAPVMNEDYQRKWQEFYQCECGSVWWAWSSDRPPFEKSQEEEA